MKRTPRVVMIEPTGARREVDLQPLPFRIGRNPGNELLLRDTRISRQQAQIISENGRLVLEDMDSRHGTFVNGQRVTRHVLSPRDSVDFGVPDSYRLVFMGEESSLDELLTRVDSVVPPQNAPARELHQLGVLLEVARAMHTGMALEDVLAAVVSAAIRLTQTERGLLLLRNEAGELEPAVARDARGTVLRPEDLQISSSVLRHVAKARRELIVTDAGEESNVGQQASVVRLQLHTIVAIPVEKMPMITAVDKTVVAQPADLLGILYLDSHAPSGAFTDLDREVLRSLAQEAATVIENARLFADARANERMEYEMGVAAEIQRQLLPTNFPVSPHFTLNGFTIPCHAVGGDFFDIVELTGGRQGIVVADIAGKGLSAALLAAMLQGVFAATAASDLSPEVAATRVNKYLCDRSGAERYATLFYGVLHPDGQLRYVNAGHVPPMIVSPDRGVRTLAAENVPIGMFLEAEYSLGSIQLQSGELLVVCTDGITEAINPEQDLLGMSGLSQILESFSGGSAAELSTMIQESVRRFTSGALQSDDMTLLIAHYSPNSGGAAAKKDPA